MTFRTGHRLIATFQQRAGRETGSAAIPTGEFELEPRFRGKMEEAFGVDFADVVLERSPCSNELTRALGTIAGARRNHIYLRSDFYDLNPSLRDHVLAHELAHIVQKAWRGFEEKSRMRDVRYRDLLEAEAHLAARDAIAGNKVRCSLRDAPSILSCWGPAGHYYTCYFVMLAAGVPLDTAKIRAFFCQMPDEVNEFDATCAGIDYYLNKANTVGYYRHPPQQVGGFSQSTDPRTLPCRPLTQKEYDRRNELDHEISVGLHSLSGLLKDDEVHFRADMLRENANDDLKFGLALHAYGDAYAHQDIAHPDLMYNPIVGHAVEANRFDPDRVTDAEKTTGFNTSPEYLSAVARHDSAAIESITDNALLVNKNEPDDVANRIPARRALYLQYVRNLYLLIQETMSNNSSPLTPRFFNTRNGRPAFDPRKMRPEDYIVSMLRQVTEIPFTMYDGDPERQARTSHRISDISKQTIGIELRSEYTPESGQEVYWKEFVPHNPSQSWWSQIRPHYSRPQGSKQDEVYNVVLDTAKFWYLRRLSYNLPPLPKYRAQPL